MRSIAILGTSSWAGKSLLTTALARWFARRGTSVAPFKGCNMSNNARVVVGGEIGAAQYFQALAAGVVPDVRMNPVLIKPEGDERSQVIVGGLPDDDLSRTPWRGRSSGLRTVVVRAFASLREEYELMLIEGAGSPAEINLRDTDIANLTMLELADARALVVADIDRGGAFAHLYGTWALLSDEERSRIGGFVLNRFRGDAGLLPPGPERLEEMTGVPTIGVLPMLCHDLPDEDGAAQPADPSHDAATVGVIRYPTASNLDEFRLLSQVAKLRWLERPEAAWDVDLLVLPGSKHVCLDLAWLRERGFDAAIRRRIEEGGLILAICGGMQMLGRTISDPFGVDADTVGLGVLPLETSFARDKIVGDVAVRFPPLPGAWHALTGLRVEGYEIRHGRCSIDGSADVVSIDGDLGVAVGPVLAVSLHGVLEDPMVLQSLLGRSPQRTLDGTFDALADAVDRHLDTDRLLTLAGLR